MYKAAHDVRISMHEFLQDLKMVTVSHFEHLDKSISRLTVLYCNVEEDTNKAAVQSSVKKTSSHTPASKKGTSSSKKRLNFDSDLGSPINYNLSTSAPSTPVRTAHNKDLSPGTERIELATADELARSLQEEEFQRLDRDNLAKDQEMAEKEELQKAINNSMQAELEQQKIAGKVKKTGDKKEEKESERDKEKKEVLLSPRRRRRIHHIDLTKNKAESAASKKRKMEESSASDDNTQPSPKRCKKSLEAKVCSRGHGKGHSRGRGRGHGSFLVSSSQTNE
jgi:hypothetical protein